MLFYTVAKLIGTEDKVSQKGNQYKKLLFVQGVETITLMCPPSFPHSGLKEGQEYKLSILYKPQFKQLELKALEPAVAK